MARNLGVAADFKSAPMMGGFNNGGFLSHSKGHFQPELFDECEETPGFLAIGGKRKYYRRGICEGAPPVKKKTDPRADLQPHFGSSIEDL